MGVAVAYNPCGWCPYKESGERAVCANLHLDEKSG